MTKLERLRETGPKYTGNTCSSTEVDAWNKGFDAASTHWIKVVEPLIEALEECAGGDLASGEGIYKAEVAVNALRQHRAATEDGEDE